MGQYGTYNLFVVAQYFIKRICRKVLSCLKVDKFAEREAAQIVALYYSVQFRIFLFQTHYAASREYYLKIGVQIVTHSQLLAPFWFFENLVYKQHFAPSLVELPCKVGYAPSLKIEVVHVYIQTLPVVCRKVFLCILKKECCLANSARPFDADHTVVPVYFIHKHAMNRSVRVLD